MRNELILNLPGSVELTHMYIDPGFEQYSELLQRVVVFVLLHAGADGLSLAGGELSTLAGKATTGAISTIRQKISSAESDVKRALNADVPTDDTDNRIRTLSLSVAEAAGGFKLTVNIETESRAIISGATTING